MLNPTMNRIFVPVAVACLLATGCPADDDGGAGGEPSTGMVATDTTAVDGDGTGSSGVDTVGDAGSEGEPGSTSSGGDDSSTGADETTDDDGTTGTTGAELCAVVLAEVHFNPLGDDDELQWIKLKNLCGEAVDLSGWTIGYGGDDYEGQAPNIRNKPLQGSIEAGGCLLVGGPNSQAANGMPVYDLPEDFAPGLSYAAEIGNGIALFDLPPGEVDGTTIPVDAVVYGPNNDNGLIDETGTPVAAPHVGLPREGGSITRTGAGPQWDMNVAPQAADCPAL